MCSGDTCEKISGILSRDSKKIEKLRRRAKERRDEKTHRQARRYQKHLQSRCWRRFLGYLGAYRGRIAGIVALILLTALFEIVLPQIVRFVLDVVVPRKDYRLLGWTIAAGAGCYLLHAAFRYLEQRSVVDFSLRLVAHIRRDLFAYQLSLPLDYFEKNGPGRLLSKLTYSTTMIKLLVETFAYTCLRTLVLIALIVIAAAFIDLKLTLILLLLAPLVAIYIRRLNRYMSEVASQLQTKNDQILQVLQRVYSSIRIFQVFGNPEKEVRRLDELLQGDLAFRLKRTMVYAGNNILIHLLTAIIVLGALWYGGAQIIQGKLSQGDVMAYVIYLSMLLYPVAEFVRASAFLQAGKIGVRTVFSVYENHAPLPEPAHPVEAREIRGDLEFRNVWFSYPGGGPGLKHLNLKAKAGRRLLVVGASGSGKSTLLNLLLRLYDPERGSVCVDGIPVQRFRLRDLRSLFTVVLQEELHAEDSVMENLYLAEEADWAAKVEGTLGWTRQLGIDRKLTRRHKKLGEAMGSGGLGFSRGELQKVALLRAARRPAPIVLLDEPTASMDPRSERQALEKMGEWFRGKTVLMISHRPVPEFQADWIAVLREGRIEAQGSHFYLLKHSAYYRDLLRRPGPPEASAPDGAADAGA